MSSLMLQSGMSQITDKELCRTCHEVAHNTLSHFRTKSEHQKIVQCVGTVGAYL
jgi:hypothetical protein